MNASPSNQIFSRNQPEMPSYFRRDRRGRDEFLSGIGAFTEEHRNTFNRLCDMWEPNLSFNRFLEDVKIEYRNAESILTSLMSRLEAARCGLIIKVVEDGQLKPHRIVLTNRDSLVFWYWAVENTWQISQISDRNPFPRISDFKKQDGFPQTILQPLSVTEVSSTLIKEYQDRLIIYAFQGLGSNAPIITPATIPLMLHAAKSKIRFSVTNSTIESILSRLIGTVASDLHKSLEQNSHEFWNTISHTIIENNKDLLVRTKGLSEDFFIAASLLKTFTQHELHVAKRNQEDHVKKQKTIKTILLYLIKKEGFIVSPHEFNSFFVPYENQWPDLRDFFISQYVGNVNRTGIPVVVKVGECFVYRNSLYPLFRAEQNNVSVELRKIYCDMLRGILKQNNRNSFAMFSNIDTFRNDLHCRITMDFPVFNQLLKMPKILLEGIIHYGTVVKKRKNMEQMKPVIRQFFMPDNIRFKELDVLLNLSPRIIFDEAFYSLGSFQRWFFRIFGRYGSYVHAMDRKKHSHSKEFLFPKRLKRKKNRSSKKRRSRLKTTSQIVRRRKKSDNQRHTIKQRENAWQDFKEAYEKKKGNE